jgi:hypothetical protein
VRSREPDERRRRDSAAAPPRTPEPLESVLALQRSAGNRAVTSMLAREPTETEALPLSQTKGATATVGFGDDQVIPIDGYTWYLDRNEVGIYFGSAAMSPELTAAAHQGKNFPKAFLSTTKMMARMTDVLITAYSTGGGSDGEAMTTLTLNFKSVKHEAVGK